MKPFGTFIGSTPNGIKVYSNTDPPYYPISHWISGIYCGLMWQCVEFARRYWIQTFGLTFSSVDYAYQLMNLSLCRSIYTQKNISLFVYRNGSRALPVIGSLVVWSKDIDSNETGHVAVVTGLSQDMIHITQQNEESVHRLLTYSTVRGRVFIKDPFLIGWITPLLL